MNQEIPRQSAESQAAYANPPFSRSSLASIARSRVASNQERAAEVMQIELAFAAGTLTLEGMSLTTDLI